jgi:hypothetical protein
MYTASWATRKYSDEKNLRTADSGKSKILINEV